MHLSKPTECTTPRVNSHVSYKLGMVMMCQCRFINCKTFTSLGALLTMRGAMSVGRKRDIGNLCTFPSILLWTLNSSFKKP